MWLFASISLKHMGQVASSSGGEGVDEEEWDELEEGEEMMFMED